MAAASDLRPVVHDEGPVHDHWFALLPVPDRISKRAVVRGLKGHLPAAAAESQGPAWPCSGTSLPSARTRTPPAADIDERVVGGRAD